MALFFFLLCTAEFPLIDCHCHTFYIVANRSHYTKLLWCYSSVFIFTADKMPEIFNSFSLIRNGRDLIKYDKNNELNIFNGLKVMTMVLVLFGHKFIYLIINPIMYGKVLEKVIQIKLLIELYSLVSLNIRYFLLLFRFILSDRIFYWHAWIWSIRFFT